MLDGSQKIDPQPPPHDQNNKQRHSGHYFSPHFFITLRFILAVYKSEINNR